MAGAILNFFPKWTTVVGGNAHPSEAFDMTPYKVLTVQITVAGLLAAAPGAANFQLMESSDGQVWYARAAAIAFAAAGYAVATYPDTLRFVRLDATVLPGNAASLFAVGVARDA